MTYDTKMKSYTEIHRVGLPTNYVTSGQIDEHFTH